MLAAGKWERIHAHGAWGSAKMSSQAPASPPDLAAGCVCGGQMGLRPLGSGEMGPSGWSAEMGHPPRSPSILETGKEGLVSRG